MLENWMPWDCGLRQIFLVPSISPGVDISQDRWLFPTERCQMFAQPRSILFQVLSHLLVKYISLARQKIKETAWNHVTLEGSHSHSSPLFFSHVTDISFSAHGRIIDALMVEVRCQKTRLRSHIRGWFPLRPTTSHFSACQRVLLPHFAVRSPETKEILSSYPENLELIS